MYRRGEDVPLNAPQQRVLDRAKWAVHEAGYRMPRINFRFVWTIEHWDESERYWSYVHGLQCQHEKSSTIWVDISTPVNEFCDTLIHELAHAIQGEIEGPEAQEEHSPEWGMIYGKIYSAYIDNGAGPSTRGRICRLRT